MTSIRVLVIGSGEVGLSILKAVVAHPKLDAALLVRPSSLMDLAKKARFDELRALGVEFVLGDANDPSDKLATAFTGFHTVVSAVSASSADLEASQCNLIHAAKAAGVKRFIPSEFGFDLTQVGRGSSLASVADKKLDTRMLLYQSGLDYILIYTGYLTEKVFKKFNGVDLSNKVITAPGPAGFETRISTISVEDAGRATAELIARDDIHKQEVRLTAGTITFNDIADIVEEFLQSKIKRVVWPLNEIEADASAPAAFARMFSNEKGTHWDKNNTWNIQVGFPVQSPRDWAKQHLTEYLEK
jgi:uncharacterized protein YbjT (DUF2867 family)